MDIAQRRHAILHPHEHEMYELFKAETDAFAAKYELMMAERGTPLPTDFFERCRALDEQRLAKRKEMEEQERAVADDKLTGAGGENLAEGTD